MVRSQTSVRVSPRAIDALNSIAERWSASRDSTVRILLSRYLEVQMQVAEEGRLTHISTVLHYPHPWPDQPDRRVRLPLRLESGVDEACTAIAFRLPGQPRRQGHHEYASRPLSDAVVTAIALDTSFVDEGLDGLPALLTHREALGMWRLVAAATRTDAEKSAMSYSPHIQQDLRDGPVAWHSQWRFEVALHMARRLLTGHAQKVAWNRKLLGAHGSELKWHEAELERSDVVFGGHILTEGAPEPPYSAEGRGAGAVWRATRLQALEGVGLWLTASGAPSYVVHPPGWTLRMPPGWHGYRFRQTANPGPDLLTLVRDGRALQIRHRGDAVIWPLTANGDPIAGFEHIIAGAGRARPIELAEAALLEPGDEARHFHHPRVPAEIAHQLGFISAATRDSLTTEAAQRTQVRIDGAIAAATGRYHELEIQEIKRLREAASDPRLFARVAAEHRLRFGISVPTWTWEVDSMADALAGNCTAKQLTYLSRAWLRLMRWQLSREMEVAWFRGFRSAYGYSDDDDDDEDLYLETEAFD